MNILRKVTSRKFLLSLCCVAIGTAMAFGVEGSEIVEIVGTIGGLVTALGGAMSFIASEAKIDAAAASFKTEENHD